MQRVLDDEGGLRLAMVDEDMLQIRGDLSSSLPQTEQALITKHDELELQFERLEI